MLYSLYCAGAVHITSMEPPSMWRGWSATEICAEDSKWSSPKCLHYKRCIHKTFKNPLWSARKKLGLFILQRQPVLPQLLWRLCSPEEVCAMTWTIQGTHAKYDALSAFSMQPGQYSSSLKFHSHYAAPRWLIQYVYLISIPGYLSIPGKPQTW